jgi:hypothetical protein
MELHLINYIWSELINSDNFVPAFWLSEVQTLIRQQTGEAGWEISGV